MSAPEPPARPWRSEAERAHWRNLFRQHNGRPRSYCLLCGRWGICDVWLQARVHLVAAGELNADGTLRDPT